MTKSPFLVEPCCDDLGPEKAVYGYEPQRGLRAIVVDNTACGPAISGVRLTADVSLEEVFRPARAMTLKNAAAGVPRGMTGAEPPLPEDPSHAAGQGLAAQVAIDASLEGG